MHSSRRCAAPTACAAATRARRCSCSGCLRSQWLCCGQRGLRRLFQVGGSFNLHRQTAGTSARRRNSERHGAHQLHTAKHLAGTQACWHGMLGCAASTGRSRLASPLQLLAQLHCPSPPHTTSITVHFSDSASSPIQPDPALAARSQPDLRLPCTRLASTSSFPACRRPWTQPTGSLAGRAPHGSRGSSLGRAVRRRAAAPPLLQSTPSLCSLLPRRWRGHWLRCWGDCSPEDIVGCCLGCGMPCVAYRCACTPCACVPTALLAAAATPIQRRTDVLSQLASRAHQLACAAPLAAAVAHTQPLARHTPVQLERVKGAEVAVLEGAAQVLLPAVAHLLGIRVHQRQPRTRLHARRRHA